MNIDHRFGARRVKADAAARSVGQRGVDPAGQQPLVELIDDAGEQRGNETGEKASPSRKMPIRPDKMGSTRRHRSAIRASLDLGKRGKRPLARFAVTDDLGRIGAAKIVGRVVDVGVGQVRDLGHPAADIIGGVEFSDWTSGAMIRLNMLASMPVPATHCQLTAFDPWSASMSVSQNHCSPKRQSISKCFTRKLAAIMRTRLCIQPEDQSWRMPASTIG